MNSPNPQRPRRKPWPLLAFWASALLALLLALSPHSTNPFLNPLVSLRLQRLFSAPSAPVTAPISTRPPCVLWMAPFLSGGGYSSEAWSFITSLHAYADASNFQLGLAHHGDLESMEFWLGLPEQHRALAYKLFSNHCNLSETIVVCHSEPGAWYPPLFQTLPCPPTGYEEPLFVIGRTMFETDRLTPEHVKRCNRMHSIWVPTEFHIRTFARSGVDPSRLLKMVEPVDVEAFDPSKHEPLALPLRVPVLVSKGPVLNPKSSAEEFVFLSVFKWEHRKGWDVLLRAFLEEFSGSDGVALHLLISSYHSDKNFGGKIYRFVQESGMKEPADGWACIHVIDQHLPQYDLPRLYKAAHAFVLPSRGEGWGRPIVEAMAMALPVIATNWSGPTEYLTEDNGYPLPADRMSKVMEGPFEGHLWAEPSSEGLRVLMRHVVSNRKEAARKGCKAREDMIRRFSPEVVAGLVADRMREVLMEMKVIT